MMFSVESFEPYTWAVDKGDGWSVGLLYQEGVKRACEQAGGLVGWPPKAFLMLVGGRYLPLAFCTNFAYGDVAAYRRGCLAVAAWLSNVQL